MRALGRKDRRMNVRSAVLLVNFCSQKCYVMLRYGTVSVP